MEFIEDDELVEITPKSVRLRKRFLKEHERKRACARPHDTRAAPRRWAGMMRLTHGHAVVC